MNQRDDLPLSGTRVLEIAHYIAGPYCAQILGDQGATVVKIEPPTGEPGRRALPVDDKGESLYYAAYNRNKRHVALDLRDQASVPALEQLLRWADVVVTNYSAGVPEKLGFGWERVHELNPRAVMVLVSGFGTYSTMRDYLAFDGIVTAMSGIVDLTGEPDGPPYNTGVLLADHSTAVQAALAATTALLRRATVGEGSFVEVSMLRSLGALLGEFVPTHDVLHAFPTRTGSRNEKRFSGMYPTADGHVMEAPLTFAMWEAFCGLIGHPEWSDEEIVRERRHVKDQEFRRRIDEAAIAWHATRSSEEVLVTLQGLGIPAGAVKSVAQVLDDDETKNLRMFERVRMIDGTLTRVSGRVFDWHGQQAAMVSDNVITDVGADAAEVLREVGVEEDVVQRLTGGLDEAKAHV